MSFLSDNKILFGAVGLAVSSAAVGYVLGRRSERLNSSSREYLVKVTRPVGPLANYIMDHGIREPTTLTSLRQETLRLKEARAMVSTDEAQFMRLLIQLTGAKKVIEVGVLTGYNTLSMALALPPDGKVVACDITDMYMEKVGSLKYFKEEEVEEKVDWRLQPAVKTLDDLLAAGEAGTFQLVFIDADKTSYDQYYEKSLKLLCRGGLIIIDNVLWGGKVCNPQELKNDEETRALHALNLKVHKDDRVEMCMMPFGDGVTVAMKI